MYDSFSAIRICVLLEVVATNEMFLVPLDNLAPGSYVEPLSFIPERWYDRPDYIKAREAYAPFSSGMSINTLTHL